MPKGAYKRKNKYTEEQKRKICPVCGKEFLMNKKFSHKQWENTICCSIKCNSQRLEYKEKQRRISLDRKAKPPIRYGPRSKEECRKISQSHKRLVELGIHHLWRGGVWHNPYSADWIGTLRRSIRERDCYTCQECGKQQEDKAFAVHHIDKNKLNCNPSNLITLCNSCHSKIHYNKLNKNYGK